MSNNTYLYDDKASKLSNKFAMSLADISCGFKSYALWNMLAWQDVKQRYRRSIIGPFWLTITTAIFISALGYLYASLFNQPVEEYIPFVAAGFIVWNAFSGIINDSCNVFTSSESMIKQVRQPFSVYVLRMVWRNVIIFAHNFIILVILVLVMDDLSVWGLLFMPLGMLIIAINGVWMGLFFGVVCSRFRDVVPMVGSLVQIAFFVTPIMWKPASLSDRAWIADFNPVTHFINIVRSPFLGESIPAISWWVVASVTLIGFILALIVLTKCRHRIAYWVG